MTTATEAHFNLIDFQQALIEQLMGIDQSGVGEHKRRSRGAAYRNAIKALVKRGYAEKEATKIADDAWDMYKLESACQDCEE